VPKPKRKIEVKAKPRARRGISWFDEEEEPKLLLKSQSEKVESKVSLESLSLDRKIFNRMLCLSRPYL
jgi:hypothetical protein